MKVQIANKSKVISQNIVLADNIYSRVIGLMFKEKPEGDGLLLDPCNSIHTFFMRYSLDVVFLSKDNSIVKIIRNLKPWRFTWIYFKASKTLELPAGNLPSELKEGDVLEVKSV